jgi:uncharacterized protein (DUF927 family)
MKKLTAAQEGTREAFVKDLRAAFDNVLEAYGKLADPVLEYNNAVDEYNTKVNDVKEFITELTGDMTAFAEEKSEKWTDSDAGQSYTAWIEAWTDLDFTDLEQGDMPPDPETSIASGSATALEEAPSEPE